MHLPLKVLGKFIFIVIFIWHIFAVAIYAIPREANDTFSKWTRFDLLPIVSPYILQTSQWQLWNIFSPDPLRRVTSYIVEKKEDEDWKELIIIHADEYSAFRHSTRMKMMINIFDQSNPHYTVIAGRFLHLLCAENNLPSQTPIRLFLYEYSLPYITKPQTRAWWNTWKPQPFLDLALTTTCP